MKKSWTPSSPYLSANDVRPGTMLVFAAEQCASTTSRMATPRNKSSDWLRCVMTRRSTGSANVQHGIAVGIDALPAANMVEQADGRRRRRQQYGVDVPGLENIEELVDVLEFQRAVISHIEGFAVKLGAPVDEHRHLSPDHIAAERKVVENSLWIARNQRIDGGLGRLNFARRIGRINGERPGRGGEHDGQHRDRSGRRGQLRETSRLKRELRRHRRHYDERYQQRKYLEIAGMRKRHMQQAQHQCDPRRRQLDAAVKRTRDQGENRNLERTEAAEIRRHPFIDQPQEFAESQDLA